MDADAKNFLKRMLETPSPSGYEQRIQSVVREYAGSFADRMETDVHGNVLAVCNPDAPLRVMLAGHCDQIGMLVSQIDEQGFLYAQTIGGWDPQQLVGQRMSVWTNQGEVPAIISRKPIHLLDQDERKQVVKLQDLWLDIGAKSKEEAAELVRVGDCITLKLGYQELRNDLANSPGMDNKTGVWIVMEALRRARESGLKCALYAVSTVQEEIGLRGAKTSAFGIDPHVGVAVDVTHATDCPTIDKRQNGEINLGGGPVVYRGPNMSPVVTERLIQVADQSEIPFQLSAIGRATPNDANSLQVTRSGVATGLISIPNRYMHSAVETISLKDIDDAASLIAAFASDLEPDEQFIPT
ncbi:MAG: M42 family metallopeptidase [Planctomycetota bacterium]